MPQTVVFRIDVTGRNTGNLNEFSTRGEGFNTYLPLYLKQRCHPERGGS